VAAPTVALWGTGGEIRAQAAACRALGWIVTGVVGTPAVEARGLAGELGVEVLPVPTRRTGRLADVVLVERGDRVATADLAEVLETGHHLVVGAPLARSLHDADERGAAAERAARRGVATHYGDSFCSSPVVGDLLEQAGRLQARPTHLSSRSILPERPDDSLATGSPIVGHGASSVAAVLLVARLCGLGRPRRVTGRDATAGDGAGTVLELDFGSELRATVHAAWGPSGAPVRDLQLATPQEVWRVDVFPTPTIERNGEPYVTSATAAVGDEPMFALGYVPQLRAFWRDVTAHRPPALPVTFGRDVVEILVAGERSASVGAAVDLPLA